MGRVQYQFTKECCYCGCTPGDGEKIWLMGSDYYCEECVDKYYEKYQYPELQEAQNDK